MRKYILIALFLGLASLVHAQDSTSHSSDTGSGMSAHAYKWYLRQARLKFVKDSLVKDSVINVYRNQFNLPIRDTVLGVSESYESLPVNRVEKYEYRSSKQGWFIGFVLLLLVLIAIFRVLYEKQARGFLKALVNNTHYREHLENMHGTYGMSNNLLLLLKSLLQGLLLFVALYPVLSIEFEGMQVNLFMKLWLYVFLFNLGDRLFRSLFSRLLIVDSFNKNVFLIQSSIDIVFVMLLTPLVILGYYAGNIWMPVGSFRGVLLLVLSIYFISKSLLSILKNKEAQALHKFILFTYLCTFEILPFLIVVKLLRI